MLFFMKLRKRRRFMKNYWQWVQRASLPWCITCMCLPHIYGSIHLHGSTPHLCIQDFDYHLIQHFESHLPRNGLYQIFGDSQTVSNRESRYPLSQSFFIPMAISSLNPSTQCYLLIRPKQEKGITRNVVPHLLQANSRPAPLRAHHKILLVPPTFARVFIIIR